MNRESKREINRERKKDEKSKRIIKAERNPRQDGVSEVKREGVCACM